MLSIYASADKNLVTNLKPSNLVTITFQVISVNKRTQENKGGKGRSLVMNRRCDFLHVTIYLSK